MRRRAWAPIPTGWIQDKTILDGFPWKPSERSAGATAIAALQLWVVLATNAEGENNDDLKSDEPCSRECKITYTSIIAATGLSRKLISSGLQHLVERQMISIDKCGRNSIYQVHGFQRGKWCKLPEKAIYMKDKIPAFHVFNRRSVCELHAMKLYLYYASIRVNSLQYVSRTLELIHEATGIPENGITRANAFLLNARLLSNIAHEKSVDRAGNAPNKYYLTGSEHLFAGMGESVTS